MIALRELVPSATAPLTLRDHPEREVLLTTLLPGATPAMVRDSGAIWLGLQVQHNFGDPARDLGAVLEAALTAEPGPVGLTDAPAPGSRLQDLVADNELTVTVHDGFDWWVGDLGEQAADFAAVLERANDSVHPTVKLTSAPAAYWADVGTKEHLRWVMTEPEDALLDALARLHSADRDRLVPEGRLVGMFRAHGLLTPVWDLPIGTGASVLEQPAAEFAAALAEMVAEAAPLTARERSARSGLANRQVTIR